MPEARVPVTRRSSRSALERARTSLAPTVSVGPPVAHARSAPSASHVSGRLVGPTATLAAARSGHCDGAGKAIVRCPLRPFAAAASSRIATIPAALKQRHERARDVRCEHRAYGRSDLRRLGPPGRAPRRASRTGRPRESRRWKPRSPGPPASAARSDRLEADERGALDEDERLRRSPRAPFVNGRLALRRRAARAPARLAAPSWR